VGDGRTVSVPRGIRRPGKQLGHIGPLTPGSRGGGNESGSRAASYGDGDLLAFLGTSDEFGGVLPEFT
jgi:hypothetical protein